MSTLRCLASQQPRERHEAALKRFAEQLEQRRQLSFTKLDTDDLWKPRYPWTRTANVPPSQLPVGEKDAARQQAEQGAEHRRLIDAHLAYGKYQQHVEELRAFEQRVLEPEQQRRKGEQGPKAERFAALAKQYQGAKLDWVDSHRRASSLPTPAEQAAAAKLVAQHEQAVVAAVSAVQSFLSQGLKGAQPARPSPRGGAGAGAVPQPRV